MGLPMPLKKLCYETKGKQMESYYLKEPYAVSTAMTDSDISDAIDGFVQSSKRLLR